MSNLSSHKSTVRERNALFEIPFTSILHDEYHFPIDNNYIVGIHEVNVFF